MKRFLLIATAAALFCCLLAVSPAWDWIEARLHHVEPYTELHFFGGPLQSKPTYTLYFEGQTRLAQVGTKGDKLRIAYYPGGAAATLSGEGCVDYSGHSIGFSLGQVSVDGTKLPPRPPYSVISKSGKVTVGAIIRLFD